MLLCINTNWKKGRFSGLSKFAKKTFFDENVERIFLDVKSIIKKYQKNIS